MTIPEEVKSHTVINQLATVIPIANPELGEEEKERVLDILDSGMLADGPEVREFEDEFASYCNIDHGVATSNGTTALHAALVGLGIGPGDRVLTTPFSFVATANAIRHAGATPVFGDINPRTFNLDPESVEHRLASGNVDAILLVHLYGLPCEMDRFAELAAEYDVHLIEDAAQAHGAKYRGDRVGTFGDAACFSFYPTKNMTTGEGGMVVTDREDVADRTAEFVNHGRTDSYEHATVGHNFRMTSMAAAIGRVQLDRLPEYIQQRRQNAKELTTGLAEAPVETPVEPDRHWHVYHQYTVRSDTRDDLVAFLNDKGVGAKVYYPICIHDQPAYDDTTTTALEAEAAADTVLSLPVHPNVSDNDVQRTIETIYDYDR